jgi:hypothetical protein
MTRQRGTVVKVDRHGSGRGRTKRWAGSGLHEGRSVPVGPSVVAARAAEFTLCAAGSGDWGRRTCVTPLVLMKVISTNPNY